MDMPAIQWQILSMYWAWIFRSARMPMIAGMNIDTIPCTV